MPPTSYKTLLSNRLSIEYKGSKAPMYVRPSGAVEAAATECPRYLSPQANDNPHHQVSPKGRGVTPETLYPGQSINMYQSFENHPQNRKYFHHVHGINEKFGGTFSIIKCYMLLSFETWSLFVSQDRLELKTIL